jgi:hypothetical protein
MIFGAFRMISGPFRFWELYSNGDIVYQDDLIRINKEEIKIGTFNYYFRHHELYLRDRSPTDNGNRRYHYQLLSDGYHQVINDSMAVSYLNHQFFLTINNRVYQILSNHEIIYSDYDHRFNNLIPKILRIKRTFLIQWMIRPDPHPNVGFVEFSEYGTTRLMIVYMKDGAIVVEDIINGQNILSIAFQGGPHGNCIVDNNGVIREKRGKDFRRWGSYFANRTSLTR